MSEFTAYKLLINSQTNVSVSVSYPSVIEININEAIRLFVRTIFEFVKFKSVGFFGEGMI
jgi:hypothetical protein